MDFETFKTCVDKTPKDTLIKWAGFVEPFLHHQALDMMEYVAAKGREEVLFTTMVGLKEDDVERLKEIPFQNICLHIPDKNHFANIQIDDSYKSRLVKILKMTSPDGSPLVWSATCQTEPEDSIREILEAYEVDINWEMQDRAQNLHDDGLISREEKAKGPIICGKSTPAMNHNVVLPDGTLVLCCMDFSMKHVLGNLSSDSWEDIVNGEAVRRLRVDMAASDSDILCRWCTSAASATS